MKYVIVLVLALAAAAFAQIITDKPLGTVRERVRVGDEPEDFDLPVNVTRVLRRDAFDRVYLTTSTITFTTATRFREDGTSRTVTFRRTVTSLIKPDTWTLRLKPDHFFYERDGRFYRQISPGEPGYTTPTQQVVR